MEPVFLLGLQTSNGNDTNTQFLQTDYANLKHLCEELEIALKETKSAHVRSKNLKFFFFF